MSEELLLPTVFFAVTAVALVLSSAVRKKIFRRHGYEIVVALFIISAGVVAMAAYFYEPWRKIVFSSSAVMAFVSLGAILGGLEKIVRIAYDDRNTENR